MTDPPKKKFGLVLPSRPKPSPFASAPTSSKISFSMKLKPSASAFNDPHSDSNSDDDATNLPKTEKATINRNLLRSQIAATNTAKIAALHAKALEEDPNVFDYDGVYDAMKESQEMVKKERDLGDGTTDALLKKPKYVEKIFAASVARKIALEQAEDRKVQKEREKEGEMFKDKDAFVTEAYKQRQLELKKIEEEEKLREERESKGDMTRFYRTLLDSHDRLSKAGRQLSPEEIARLTAEREVREKEEALELERKIALSLASGDLRLNASDEIVDKRVLLTAGLNVSRSKTRMIEAEREAEEKARREAEERQRAKREEERRRREEEKEKRRVKEEMVKRMQEEAERQEEEERERRKREREKEVKEMAVKMARKTTEETISEARKRYLARKAAEKGTKEESEEESD